MGPLLAVTLVAALAGCSQQGQQTYMEGSRSELYKSVKQLAADSSAAIVGEVVEQRVVEDVYGNAITLSDQPAGAERNPRRAAGSGAPADSA